MAQQTSNIDATIPPDNLKADKAAFRANFSAAKNELNEMFRRTGLAYQIAHGRVPL